MAGAPSPRRWLFLGVLVEVLTGPDAPVAVARAVLPEGASPPAHLHAALDDSFYVLDGRMAIHCGDDVWLAGPGSWVQFPAGVREIGRPATGADVPDAAPGPTVAELDQAFASHGITNVGPAMEQAEAERLVGQLAGAVVPS